MTLDAVVDPVEWVTNDFSTGCVNYDGDIDGECTFKGQSNSLRITQVNPDTSKVERECRVAFDGEIDADGDITATNHELYKGNSTTTCPDYTGGDLDGKICAYVPNVGDPRRLWIRQKLGFSVPGKTLGSGGRAWGRFYDTTDYNFGFTTQSEFDDTYSGTFIPTPYAAPPWSSANTDGVINYSEWLSVSIDHDTPCAWTELI